MGLSLSLDCGAATLPAGSLQPARLHHLEECVADFRRRHEVLLEALEEDEDYDVLSCLPGLAHVQEELTKALVECRIPHILEEALKRTPKE